MANEDNNSLYNIPVAVVDNTGVGASLMALLYYGVNHESPSERRHNNQIREDDDINNNED